MSFFPYLTAVLAALFSLQGASSIAEETRFRPIGPGAWHATHQVTSGPLNFNVLRIDLANPQTTIEAEPGLNVMFKGETVASAARREEEPGQTNILAGVNADFWAMSPKPYLPVGPLVSDGWIHSMGSRKRSVFAITKDEKVHIGPVSFSLHVESGSSRIPIDSVNVPKPGAIVLITPPFGSELPPSTSTRFLLTLERPEMLPNQKVGATISPIEATASLSPGFNQAVLIVPPDSRWLAGLTAGTRVNLDARIPEVSGVVTSMVGGGPRLVHQGQVDINAKKEGVGDSFVKTRHPRTAAGVGKDGKTVYLVTVDGRQPKISIGQSLNELAEYMKGLGCWEALNLDGGGSTTMVVDDKVVNRPSDLKGARPVTNSLLVVAKVGSGTAASLALEPAGDPLLVPVGTQVWLDIKAFDENMTPISLTQDAQLQAGANGGFRVVGGNTEQIVVQADETASEGTVTVGLGEARGSLKLRSVKPDKVRVSPSVLVLDPGETLDLEVSMISPAGQLLLQPQMIQTKASDGRVSATQTRVEALSRGESLLHLRIGKMVEAVPVYVGLSQTSILSGFNDLSKLRPVTGTRFVTGATNTRLDQGIKKEGSAALRLDYVMTKGGSSRITLPVEGKVPAKPVKFGVWVYGDGKEAWLRSTVVDATGRAFIADFTEGSKGIYWKDTWRYATCWLDDLTPEQEGVTATPVFPLVIRDIYLQQDQEALKAQGAILLDSLQAVYPPTPAPASQPLQ